MLNLELLKRGIFKAICFSSSLPALFYGSLARRRSQILADRFLHSHSDPLFQTGHCSEQRNSNRAWARWAHHPRHSFKCPYCNGSKSVCLVSFLKANFQLESTAVLCTSKEFGKKFALLQRAWYRAWYISGAPTKPFNGSLLTKLIPCSNLCHF